MVVGTTWAGLLGFSHTSTSRVYRDGDRKKINRPLVTTKICATLNAHHVKDHNICPFCQVHQNCIREYWKNVFWSYEFDANLVQKTWIHLTLYQWLELQLV